MCVRCMLAMVPLSSIWEYFTLPKFVSIETQQNINENIYIEIVFTSTLFLFFCFFNMYI